MTTIPRGLEETDYMAFVDHLFQSKRSGADGYMHAAIGHAGEAAEIMDNMKKMWVYDRPLDHAKILEEMGDSFHYFMMLCICMDVSWGDVMANNITKLKKRYPNGFSKADAIARADKV